MTYVKIKADARDTYINLDQVKFFIFENSNKIIVHDVSEITVHLISKRHNFESTKEQILKLINCR